MTPQSNLPEGVRSKIFKAFVRHLKDDPVLSRYVKTWDDYEGRAEDFKIIPRDACPAIRFTISASPMSPATFASHNASFGIDMELHLPGTNQYEFFDFWEAVETAMAPFLAGDAEIVKSLYAETRIVYGTHYISRSAVNHAKYSNPPMIIGTGTATFVLTIRR